MHDRRSREIAAALDRFPNQAEKINRLVERDEDFRDMCEELVAAQDALARLGGAETMMDETARRAECEGWIRRLADEMDAALRVSEVIPLPFGRRRS